MRILGKSGKANNIYSTTFSFTNLWSDATARSSSTISQAAAHSREESPLVAQIVLASSRATSISSSIKIRFGF